MRLLQKNTWIAGVSGTVIDDDAKSFKDVFNVPDTWDFLYFPSKVNFEGDLSAGFSVEASFTYTQLKKGKLVSELNVPRSETINLFAVDVNAKYNVFELLNGPKSLTPYGIGGFGYTRRSYAERKTAITGNFGFGLSVWVYKGLGFNVQSMAKFALNNAYGKNYLQHSVGVVYRFSFLTGGKTPDEVGRRYNLFRNDKDE